MVFVFAHLFVIRANDYFEKNTMEKMEQKPSQGI